jgi:hypothetical protein
MNTGESKWTPYLERIMELLRETNSATKIARQVDREFNLKLNKTEEDLFRTYIRRKRNKKNKKANIDKTKNLPYEEKTWDERGDTATYEYKGEKSITTLKEALDFSEVEVERHIFNSWDVTMSTGKRTNYQTKVWFRRIEKLDLVKPEYRHIEMKTSNSVQMWVIIGCVHMPFHDKTLWDKFLCFLENHKKDITGIILNGDFLDLRSLSAYEEWLKE